MPLPCLHSDEHLCRHFTIDARGNLRCASQSPVTLTAVTGQLDGSLKSVQPRTPLAGAQVGLRGHFESSCQRIVESGSSHGQVGFGQVGFDLS